MTITLPLNEMTVAEKLKLMEDLWADLSKNTQNLPPPAWHADVLAQREAALNAGEDSFEDWEIAKERIRRETS